MSFTILARRVRDTTLLHPQRASALRSCVRFYRPIGHGATLYYLDAKAGPIEHDEAALLRALDLLETSRALWQEDVRRYAVQRRQAKRRGVRVPLATERSPFPPGRWYGAPREAALHAVRYWRERQPRLGSPDDPDVLAMGRLLDASVAAEGRLGPAELAELNDLAQRAEIRWNSPMDPFERRWTGRLLMGVAHHTKVAASDGADP